MARMEIVVAVAIMLMAVPVLNMEMRDSNDCIGSLCYSKPPHYDEYLEQMKLSLQNTGPEMLKRNEDDDDLDFGIQINDEDQNCRSITQLVQPYVHKGNETNLLVVQLDIFKQRVKSTECFPISENIGYDTGECFQDLAKDWKGECKVKYSKIDLFMFNTNTGAIQANTADVPVCCYCSIKMN